MPRAVVALETSHIRRAWDAAPGSGIMSKRGELIALLKASRRRRKKAGERGDIFALMPGASECHGCLSYYK
jgi:hypothetical protein